MAVNVTPASPVTVTVAPGITPPVASVTDPLSDEVPCANTGAATNAVGARSDDCLQTMIFPPTRFNEVEHDGPGPNEGAKGWSVPLSVAAKLYSSLGLSRDYPSAACRSRAGQIFEPEALDFPRRDPIPRDRRRNADRFAKTAAAASVIERLSGPRDSVTIRASNRKIKPTKACHHYKRSPAENSAKRLPVQLVDRRLVAAGGSTAVPTLIAPLADEAPQTSPSQCHKRRLTHGLTRIKD